MKKKKGCKLKFNKMLTSFGFERSNNCLIMRLILWGKVLISDDLVVEERGLFIILIVNNKLYKDKRKKKKKRKKQIISLT